MSTLRREHVNTPKPAIFGMSCADIWPRNCGKRRNSGQTHRV